MIEEGTGLKQSTISRVASGDTKKPSNKTAELILKYILNMEPGFFALDLTNETLVKLTRVRAQRMSAAEAVRCIMGVDEEVPNSAYSLEQLKVLELATLNLAKTITERIKEKSGDPQP